MMLNNTDLSLLYRAQCSAVNEADLEELAGSVPNALHHMLTEPGRRVILHAAG